MKDVSEKIWNDFCVWGEIERIRLSRHGDPSVTTHKETLYQAMFCKIATPRDKAILIHDSVAKWLKDSAFEFGWATISDFRRLFIFGWEWQTLETGEERIFNHDLPGHAYNRVRSLMKGYDKVEQARYIRQQKSHAGKVSAELRREKAS